MIDSVILNSSKIPFDQVMYKEEAQNKTLKGSMEVELSTPKNPADVDTMYVEFYIVDRSKNESNVERSPKFSIKSESGTVIKPQE